MPGCQYRVPVACKNDFALFCDFEPAVYRACRLCKDCAVSRPAAAPDSAAAPMEKRYINAVALCPFGYPPLRAVERKGR